ARIARPGSRIRSSTAGWSSPNAAGRSPSCRRISAKRLSWSVHRASPTRRPPPSATARWERSRAASIGHAPACRTFSRSRARTISARTTPRAQFSRRGGAADHRGRDDRPPAGGSARAPSTMHLLRGPRLRGLAAQSALLRLPIDEGARGRELIAQPDIIDEASHVCIGRAALRAPGDELGQCWKLLKTDLLRQPPAPAPRFLLDHDTCRSELYGGGMVPVN